MQRAELRSQQRGLSLCLRHADTGPEATVDAAAPVIAITEPAAFRMNQWIETERQPEGGRGDAGTDEVVRRNAGDGKGRAVEANALAQHRRIAGKSSLPEILTDDNRGRGRELWTADRFESAAALRRNAED